LTGKPVGSSPLVRRYIKGLLYSEAEKLPMLFQILYERNFHNNIEANFRLMKYADRLANMGYNKKRIVSIIDFYNGWYEGECKLDDNATYKEIAKIIKFMPIDDYHRAYNEYQVELFKQNCQKVLVGANLTEPDIDFIHNKFYNANPEITAQRTEYHGEGNPDFQRDFARYKMQIRKVVEIYRLNDEIKQRYCNREIYKNLTNFNVDYAKSNAALILLYASKIPENFATQFAIDYDHIFVEIFKLCALGNDANHAGRNYTTMYFSPSDTKRYYSQYEHIVRAIFPYFIEGER
jgi:hypothetical protein